MFLGLLAALDERTDDADRLLGRAVAMAAGFRSVRFEAEALPTGLRFGCAWGIARALGPTRSVLATVEGTGWESVLGVAGSLL